MEISIAPYDNKKYIKVKPKFVRYTLLKKMNLCRTEKGIRPKGNSNYLYASDYGDVLRLSKFLGGKPGQFIKNKSKRFTLRIRNNKLYVYYINDDKVRDISGNPINLTSWLTDTSRLAQKRNPITKRRFTSVLLNFFARNGIKLNKEEDLNVLLLKAAYPAVRELQFSNSQYVCFSPVVSSIFKRRTSFKKALEDIFGNSGKSVSKLVYPKFGAKSVDNLLSFGVFWKNLVPFDCLLKYLETPDSTSGCCEFRTDKTVLWRRILKFYPEERRKILLSGLTARDFSWMRDVVLTFQNFPKLKTVLAETLVEKPKNFKEIHDGIVAYARKSAITDFELSQKKLINIDGQEIGNLKIVVPKTQHELIDWGNHMSNCIAGYARIAQEGQVLLLGVLKNDVLTYNISIRNNRLEQFYGRFNSAADPEDKKKVTDFLSEVKLIQPQQVIDSY